ncbi:Soyasapogenol B glucuronide galactosyltransferase [Stylosanthes scabra]|uniref:Soyasapogenol B glucuronide galactosyltransferase n=1 Tax=Stylosanthes scabra TaxID=79078 RepID=A0ABU6TKV1_9FABA|nr:Soyasapogenol B glucuronide galactosyltransferase [Stylosanthes scabra]
MVDMARVFAMNGVDVTIITTSGNAAIFQSSIDRDSSHGVPIRTHAIEFPALQVGLPPEIEKLFEELEADCIVSDMFHPWTVDAAAKLGVPRIVFYAASCLSRCAVHSLEQHGSSHKKVGSDDEKFILEGLPHVLQMSKLQLPDWIRKPNGYTYLMNMINDSAKRSYGAVFNSFFEFEGAYGEHYKEAYGTKCWSLGPVSMWVNKDDSDKVQRGHQENVLVDEEEEEGWLQWLNSKKEGSVLYVSFGSLNKFPSSQLVEIAHALENSGHDFIWVVRKTKNDDDHNNELGFMEEFEERVRSSNRGYLIWGWAPQLLILENPSIGGMVTHCGWNTVVESMSVGLAMVTWPLFAEHFFNEKLVVDVLRIGVSVGNKEWRNWNEFGDGVVKREDIGRAIELVMGCGEEGEGMRVRAKALSDAAKKAIEFGGTSHANVVELIQELRSLKGNRRDKPTIEFDLEIEKSLKKN